MVTTLLMLSPKLCPESLTLVPKGLGSCSDHNRPLLCNASRMFQSFRHVTTCRGMLKPISDPYAFEMIPMRFGLFVLRGTHSRPFRELLQTPHRTVLLVLAAWRQNYPRARAAEATSRQSNLQTSNYVIRSALCILLVRS